jgi:hypothetical protein
MPELPDYEPESDGPVNFMRSGVSIDFENTDLETPFSFNLSSTCVVQARYDPIGEFLFIEFTDGTGYEYQGVPRWVATDLIQSSSAGRYFNYHIRNEYIFDQLYF